MLLFVWILIAGCCAVILMRRAGDKKALAVAMGLLLGPLGVWLFPRRTAVNYRPLILVLMGCSALFLFSLILTLLRAWL